MNSTITFIGAGKITQALVAGLLRSGARAAESILACDPSEGALTQLKTFCPGIKTSTSNFDGARFGHIVVIATPPPEVVRVLAELRYTFQPDAIIISLAAGVSLAKMLEAARGVTVLRVMPNTPSMVGEGMNLVCFAPGTSAEKREEVQDLLRAFGPWLEIPEAAMEAGGALCAVGPTFLFPIVQSLMATAIEAGLTEPEARMATAQVFIGTGRAVAVSKRSVPELNGMIGLHTLPEAQAMQLVAAAYQEALGKLKGLAARMAAAG